MVETSDSQKDFPLVLIIDWTIEGVMVRVTLGILEMLGISDG